RRTREDFELDQALASGPHGSADAIGAGITAADDHNIFAFGRNEISVAMPIQQGTRVGGQKVHREVNAFEVAPVNRKIARFGCAGAENGGIEFFEKLFRRIIFSDLGIGKESDPFSFHLLDAAEDDLLFIELHVRNAIHEQATDAVSAFENRDEM